MYCRNVNFKLKAKSAVEFTRILEEEIIPSLRGQRGFEVRSASSLQKVMRRSLSVSGMR